MNGDGEDRFLLAASHARIGFFFQYATAMINDLKYFVEYAERDVKYEIIRCTAKGRNVCVLSLVGLRRDTLRDLIINLKRQDYKVKVYFHGWNTDHTVYDPAYRFHISWTSLRTSVLWRIVFAFLIIRRILKKYACRKVAEWIIPPHGWIYLKAKEDFVRNQ